MPAWIHDRAMKLKKQMEDTYPPEKAKQVAFAVATQQAHKTGKSPKTFGTSEGRAEAKAKFDKPKSEYKKTASAITFDGFADEMQKIAAAKWRAIATGADSALKQRLIDAGLRIKHTPELQRTHLTMPSVKRTVQTPPLPIRSETPYIEHKQGLFSRLQSYKKQISEDMKDPDPAVKLRAAISHERQAKGVQDLKGALKDAPTYSLEDPSYGTRGEWHPEVVKAVKARESARAAEQAEKAPGFKEKAKKYYEEQDRANKRKSTVTNSEKRSPYLIPGIIGGAAVLGGGGYGLHKIIKGKSAPPSESTSSSKSE